MDVTPLFNFDSALQLVEEWYRNPMGQKPSPYVAIQQAHQLKRLMLGNCHNPENVCHWDNIHNDTAFYKGMAKSWEILDLVLWLHKIALKGKAFIYVIWVAGT